MVFHHCIIVVLALISVSSAVSVPLSQPAAPTLSQINSTFVNRQIDHIEREKITGNDTVLDPVARSWLNHNWKIFFTGDDKVSLYINGVRKAQTSDYSRAKYYGTYLKVGDVVAFVAEDKPSAYSADHWGMIAKIQSSRYSGSYYATNTGGTFRASTDTSYNGLRNGCSGSNPRGAYGPNRVRTSHYNTYLRPAYYVWGPRHGGTIVLKRRIGGC